MKNPLSVAAIVLLCLLSAGQIVSPAGEPYEPNEVSEAVTEA